MGEKKSYQAWTISDEFWEAIKGAIPKKERDTANKYKNAPGQGQKPMPERKALEGIFYVAANGKYCLVNTEVAVQCTEGFRNGWQPVSLKRFGVRVWSSKMNWKESAGSGKAWMAVW